MNTDKIKDKVLAQYLGQRIYWQGITGILNAHNLVGASSPIEDARLLLKPLSAITVEDEIEVGRYIMDVKYLEHGREFIRQIDKKEFPLSVFNPLNTLMAFQYLISKGYDLPNYLLEGKTLHESGLAIYE